MRCSLIALAGIPSREKIGGNVETAREGSGASVELMQLGR